MLLGPRIDTLHSPSVYRTIEDAQYVQDQLGGDKEDDWTYHIEMRGPHTANGFVIGVYDEDGLFVDYI